MGWSVPAPFTHLAHAPDDLDVALAFLNDDLTAELANHCLDATAIDGTAIAKTDTLMLVGVPQQTSRGSTCVIQCHSTRLRGRDRRDISVEWNEALLEGTPKHLETLGLDPSRRLYLKKPNGISGGGLWRVVKPGTTSAQLVGVTYRWSPRAQLSVPADLWLPWLARTLDSA